jgi:cohesin complex subunit SA-1/2
MYSGLAAEVFAGNLTLDEVAAEWMKRFHIHESDAVAEIVNFVLRSAGCNLKVDRHDIEDPDGCTSKLTELQDEFQAVHHHSART